VVGGGGGCGSGGGGGGARQRAFGSLGAPERAGLARRKSDHAFKAHISPAHKPILAHCINFDISLVNNFYFKHPSLLGRQLCANNRIDDSSLYKVFALSCMNFMQIMKRNNILSFH
jgi:hypothetical protein